MRATTRTLALAAALMMIAAVPALGAVDDDDTSDFDATIDEEADDEAEEPTTRTEAVYFRCSGDLPAQTLEEPTWSTAAPSQSVTEGGGCGNGDNVAANAALGATGWTGTFVGNLDHVTVELHNMIWIGSARMDGEFTLDYVFTADDEELAAETVTVEPYTTPDNYGITEEITFAIDDIGLMVEDGDGTIEREYRLEIEAADGHNIWAWDTTEVPAGITFNGPR